MGGSAPPSRADPLWDQRDTVPACASESAPRPDSTVSKCCKSEAHVTTRTQRITNADFILPQSQEVVEGSGHGLNMDNITYLYAVTIQKASLKRMCVQAKVVKGS